MPDACGKWVWSKIAYALCLAFSAGGGMLPATVLAAGALIVQGAQLGQLLGPPTFAAAVAAHGTWSATVWPLATGSGLAMVLALLLRRQEQRQANP